VPAPYLYSHTFDLYIFFSLYQVFIRIFDFVS